MSKKQTQVNIEVTKTLVAETEKNLSPVENGFNGSTTPAGSTIVNNPSKEGLSVKYARPAPKRVSGRNFEAACVRLEKNTESMNNDLVYVGRYLVDYFRDQVLTASKEHGDTFKINLVDCAKIVEFFKRVKIGYAIRKAVAGYLRLGGYPIVWKEGKFYLPYSETLVHVGEVKTRSKKFDSRADKGFLSEDSLKPLFSQDGLEVEYDAPTTDKGNKGNKGNKDNAGKSICEYLKKTVLTKVKKEAKINDDKALIKVLEFITEDYSNTAKLMDFITTFKAQTVKAAMEAEKKEKATK